MADLILSHQTALAYWNDPHIRKPDSRLGKTSGNRALSHTAAQSEHSVAQALSESAILERLPAPADVLTAQRSGRQMTSLVRTHCIATELPGNSLVVATELADGRLLVCSPELTLLQMSRFMSVYELTELAYELCGDYAIAPLARSGMVERRPVTTPQALRRFVANADGMTGVKKARLASTSVLAGSRSPKETQLAMLVALPRRQGGFGLVAPRLNPHIEVTPEVAGALGYGVITPDLYWPSARIAVEYDSREWHSEAQRLESDAARRNAYRLLGIDVVTITAKQFASFSNLHGIFASIAKRVDPTYRKPTARQLELRRTLHEFFVRGRRAQRFETPWQQLQ